MRKKVGENKYSVKPNLERLNEVCGTYPTPYGETRVVSKRQADGKIKTRITAPNEIQIES